MSHSQLVEAIRALGLADSLSDGTPVKAITAASIAILAAQFQIFGREAEIAALEEAIIPRRYFRNFKTFAIKDQIRLLKARVAVVGLGGLGGTVVEVLARSGVGRFILIDGDRFDETNLNRQTLSTIARLNRFKAEVAAERIAAINPGLEARLHCAFLTAESVEKLLAGAEIVIDCLDNIPGRFILQQAAERLRIPLVSAAIGGVAGHITVIHPGDPGLKLIYGNAETTATGGSEREQGCLPHAITILSALSCSEAIKLLLDRGGTLRNRILLMDLADNTFQTLDLVPGIA